MRNDDLTDKFFLRIMALINSNKPAFGSLNVSFYYHQGKVTKVQLLSKLETVIFEKNEDKKE